MNKNILNQKEKNLYYKNNIIFIIKINKNNDSNNMKQYFLVWIMNRQHHNIMNQIVRS